MTFLNPSHSPLLLPLVLTLSLCMLAGAQMEEGEEMMVLNEPVSTGQCCYNDACNNDVICASRQSSLTDSCGVSYIVNSDCKLSESDCCFKDPCRKGTSTNCSPVGKTVTDTCTKPHQEFGKCAPTTGSCCFRDGCDKSKDQCTIPGGVIVNSCPRTYDVSDSCEISAVQCCFPDCNENERCAELRIFNNGYGVSTLRRELFCQGFEQLVTQPRCDAVITSSEIVAEGARIDLERQAAIEFPSAGIIFTVELLPLESPIPGYFEATEDPEAFVDPEARLLSRSLRMEGGNMGHKFKGNSGTSFQAVSRKKIRSVSLKKMVNKLRKRPDWQSVFKMGDFKVKHTRKNGKEFASFDLKFNDVFRKLSSGNEF